MDMKWRATIIQDIIMSYKSLGSKAYTIGKTLGTKAFQFGPSLGSKISPVSYLGGLAANKAMEIGAHKIISRRDQFEDLLKLQTPLTK